MATKREAIATPGGILVVDKPSGMTSMDVVAVVRRRAGGIKTGHAGTLDPLATGVLVLALGKATKVLSRLMATDKEYETEIALDATTETLDAETTPVPVQIAAPPDEAVVRATLGNFAGTFDQRPPAYSAVKVRGRRAYKLARGGQVEALPPRSVTVKELELLAHAWPNVRLRIRCEKGFYVRSLARDLGEALGTGGYCVSIRRTVVGPFTLAEAVLLDAIEDPMPLTRLLPTEDALGRL